MRIHKYKNGQFVKGHIPWIQGKHFSIETRRKMSLAKKGKKKPPRSLAHREKLRSMMIKKWSEAEFREKNIRQHSRKQIEVMCLECGQVLRRAKCYIGLYEGQKYFCNRECRGRWMSKNLRGKNGLHWEGKDWKIAIKKWRKENMERILYLNLRRRALRENAEGNHSFEEWIALKKYYKNKCLCCGKTELEVMLTQDHITPLIKEGTDYIENIQPLCQSCNCKKYTKIIDYRVLK